MEYVHLTIIATGTDEHVPANRYAVGTATFERLSRESDHPAGLWSIDQLHITRNTEDSDILDALDDELRAHAQGVEMFEGVECYVLFPGDGIDGCDVWARCGITKRDENTMEDLSG